MKFPGNLFSKKDIDMSDRIPGNAADKRISAVYSAYNQAGQPTPYLKKLGLQFVNTAFEMDLKEVSARIPNPEVDYISIYPGEHYNLPAAIVNMLQPKTIVELGTHLGYSALCMKKYLPPSGKLFTFDVIPWNGFNNTILKQSDFDSQLVQCVDDITNKQVFEKYRPMLEDAELIFMDALKDGVQEYKFLENLSTVKFKNKCLFVFDDIRLWNMLDIWFHMDKPKLDLTSFGHWSGTGIVEWN